MPNRTDEQLNAQFEAIKNETNEGGNTRTRVYNALKDFFDTVVSRLSGKVDKVTGSRLITSDEATKLNNIATPAPAGVVWKTGPAASPTITAHDITQTLQETAAVITFNGTDITIPATSFTYGKPSSGKSRLDTIFARYDSTAGTVGYGRLAGDEADEGNAVAKATPAGALLVRYVLVTSAGSTTTTPTPTAKLYSTTGTNTDGAMTQKAATSAFVAKETTTSLAFAASTVFPSKGSYRTVLSGNVTSLAITSLANGEVVTWDVLASADVIVTIPDTMKVEGTNGQRNISITNGKTATFQFRNNGTETKAYRTLG